MSEVKIPAGYIQTEVGVIPEDWDLLPAKEITSFVGGHSFSSNSAQDTGIRWLKISNVGVNKVKWDAKSFLPYSFLEIYSKYVLKENDVVIALTRPILSNDLKIAKLNLFDTPSLLNQRVAKLEVTPKGDIRYAYYALQTSNFIASMNLAMAGTDPPNIGTKALCNIQILVPPRKEQTAIANALTDTDNLIQSLEKLIAKKEAIKTGTMQQLLTGKTRLPEFATREDGSPKKFKQTELGRIPEDWEFTTMNEVTNSCSSGATPYRGNSSYYNGTNHWITSGELNYCVINDTIEKISDEAVEKTNLKVHPPGTFLMAITGLEAAGTRGACGIVGRPSTTNQSCMAIYPNKKLNSKYLYFWYIYNGDNLAFKYCQGTKQMSYTAGIVKKLPIYLPEKIEEQTAIANILSDMDAEIQALQERLEKTKEIKQGMMQQLLTGKVRLLSPDKPIIRLLW